MGCVDIEEKYIKKKKHQSYPLNWKRQDLSFPFLREKPVSAQQL